MVSYDPQRSETHPRPLKAAPEAHLAAQINPANLRLIEEKRLRIGRMTAHREHILMLEKHYEESIVTTKDVLTDILRDPQQAIRQANAMSASLTSIFLDEQGATVMMVAANKLDDLANQHALNVMILTMVICKGMGVSRDIMNAAGVGALLHDIGKTSISKTVLRKWPRNRAEETLYRLHCDYGIKIVGEHANPGVRAVIRQHHECADGQRLSRWPQWLPDQPAGARCDHCRPLRHAVQPLASGRCAAARRSAFHHVCARDQTL